MQNPLKIASEGVKKCRFLIQHKFIIYYIMLYKKPGFFDLPMSKTQCTLQR